MKPAFVFHGITCCVAFRSSSELWASIIEVTSFIQYSLLTIHLIHHRIIIVSQKQKINFVSAFYLGNIFYLPYYL